MFGAARIAGCFRHLHEITIPRFPKSGFLVGKWRFPTRNPLECEDLFGYQDGESGKKGPKIPGIFSKRQNFPGPLENFQTLPWDEKIPCLIPPHGFRRSSRAGGAGIQRSKEFGLPYLQIPGKLRLKAGKSPSSQKRGRREGGEAEFPNPCSADGVKARS